MAGPQKQTKGSKKRPLSQTTSSHEGGRSNNDDLWGRVRSATSRFLEDELVWPPVQRRKDNIEEDKSRAGTAASGDVVDPTAVVSVAKNEPNLHLDWLPKGWTQTVRPSSRERRSPAWDHGFDIQEPNGTRYWVCKICHVKRENDQIRRYILWLGGS